MNTMSKRLNIKLKKNSFKQLPQDPSQQFEMKVTNWTEKWHSNKILDSGKLIHFC